MIGPAALLAAAAYAQPTPPEADDIIVTAVPDQQRIDRKVYAVKDSAQAQVESGLDVLRRLPSVTINSDQQVQLLGDAQVKILIDGHAVAEGSKVLKSLPAAQIAQVEVMTNPSAVFSAEGTAGVINIVTRHDMPAGLAGAATVKGDNLGGGSIKLAPSFAAGRWDGSLSLELAKDRYRADTTQVRTAIDPASAYALRTHRSLYDNGFTSRGSLTYAPRASRKWTLTLDHSDNDGFWNIYQRADSRGTDHIPLTEFGHPIYRNRRDTASLAYAWNGKRQGENLNVSAIYNDAISHEDRAVADDFGGATQSLLFAQGHDDHSVELKADYAHPFGRADMLSFGGSIVRLHQARLDGLAAVGDRVTAAPFGPDRIAGAWTTAAAYATLQFPIAGWTLLPGLRLEDRQARADALGAYSYRNDAFLFPSVHASRRVAKSADISLSYSRRVEWPDLRQLDPLIRYTDPLNGFSGNPALRPQLTDAFEAAINYTPGKQQLSLKLYDRETKNAWLLRAHLLPNGVSVGSIDNLGSLRKLGGELVAQGPIWKGWRYDVSADFNARRSDLFVSGAVRSDQYFAYSGNAQIEYQDKPDGKPGANHLQLSLDYYGPLHAFQSSSAGWTLGAINWTHSFNARLSSVLKVSNVFASDATTSRIFAEDYYEVTRRLDDGRFVSAALICRLGKVR